MARGSHRLLVCSLRAYELFKVLDAHNRASTDLTNRDAAFADQLVHHGAAHTHSLGCRWHGKCEEIHYATFDPMGRFCVHALSMTPCATAMVNEFDRPRYPMNLCDKFENVHTSQVPKVTKG